MKQTGMITDKDSNEIEVDKEGRLVIDESIPMMTWEDYPDLENCTIRELEMFKIGFEYGRKIEGEKKCEK